MEIYKILWNLHNRKIERLEFRLIFFENFNPYVVRAKDITNSLLILAFYGLLHNLSIMTILRIIL